MRFDILTLFPDIFTSFSKESLLAKAQKKNLLEIHTHNVRDFTDDVHNTADDKPYGGGPGMIMKIEPVYRALKSVPKKRNRRVIYLTPRGTQLTQAHAQKLAGYSQLIFLCGRYEGIDDRITHFIDEELSIGSYVLNGGEVAAMVVIEAVGRLIPGVIGKEESLLDESFSDGSTLEYPQFTRPERFKGLTVPDVLLSGNHKEIKKWRETHRYKHK